MGCPPIYHYFFWWHMVFGVNRPHQRPYYFKAFVVIWIQFRPNYNSKITNKITKYFIVCKLKSWQHNQPKSVWIGKYHCDLKTNINISHRGEKWLLISFLVNIFFFLNWNMCELYRSWSQHFSRKKNYLAKKQKHIFC